MSCAVFRVSVWLLSLLLCVSTSPQSQDQDLPIDICYKYPNDPEKHFTLSYAIEGINPPPTMYLTANENVYDLRGRAQNCTQRMTVSYDSSQNGLTENIEFSVRLHKRAKPIVKYWVSLNSTHDERAINLKWAEQGIDLQVDISSSAAPGSKLLPNLNFGNYLEFDPVYDVPKEKFNCACVHQDGIPSVLTLTSPRYLLSYPQPFVLMTFEVFNQVPGDLPYAKQIQMDGWRSSCAGKHASKSPPATRLVVLDSMNKFKLRVGMRNAIGPHATRWEIFEFLDFEQVNVPQQRAFDISNLVAVGYSRLNLSEIHKKNVIVLVDFSRQSVDCNMEAARLIFNAVVFNGQVVTKESYELPRLSKKTHFVRTMPLTSQELKRCLITESPPTRTETPADPANSAMRY